MSAKAELSRLAQFKGVIGGHGLDTRPPMTATSYFPSTQFAGWANFISSESISFVLPTY
jgi:hypothetical protein